MAEADMVNQSVTPTNKNKNDFLDKVNMVKDIIVTALIMLIVVNKFNHMA